MATRWTRGRRSIGRPTAVGGCSTAEYEISLDDLRAALSYAAGILSEENVRLPA